MGKIRTFGAKGSTIVTAAVVGALPGGGNLLGTNCPAGYNTLVGTEMGTTNHNFAFWVVFN